MTLIRRLTETSPPPAASRVVWEGRPSWRSAAVRIWKAPFAALYFGLLLLDGLRLILQGPNAPPGALEGEAKLLAASLLTLGLLLLLAWLTGRTTRYAIENQTVVMRYGIALQATLHIPFSAIEEVGVRVHKDSTGDIAIRLKPGPQVIYPKLWPHARPWSWFRPEPMLRCVPEAGVLGPVLCRAIAAAALDRPGEPETAPVPIPLAQRAPDRRRQAAGAGL